MPWQSRLICGARLACTDVTYSSSFRRFVIPSAELTSGYMPECVLMGLLPCRDLARVVSACAVPTATRPPSAPAALSTGCDLGCTLVRATAAAGR